MKSNKEIICFIQEQHKKKIIPLHEPLFIGNEKKYLIDCIDSNYVSSIGSYVDKLEKDISSFSNTAHAVAVVNGTAGLQICLQLLGVKSNDEVLTQALSFIATSNAIHFNNAFPVYIDVDYDTMGMSPFSLRQYLEDNAVIRENQCFNKISGRRISACMPMHTFGLPCRIDEISSICKEWSIALIEDAAESLGSEYKNKKIGSFGDMAVFSFNGNKIVTAGGGGIIVTNNLELAQKAKHLTTTAKKPHQYEFIHDDFGYNFRLPNINASLVCAQLEQLNIFLNQKRKLALNYLSFFNSKPKFKNEIKEAKSNFWLNAIEFDNIEERNSFLHDANRQHVLCRPIWTLSYHLKMYRDCLRDHQTNAEKLYKTIVNIPSSVLINDED